MLHQTSLLDTVDNLLADLNDAIFEMREVELASKTSMAATERMETTRNSASSSTTLYTGPRDKTVASISSLPDAFGGPLQKATYNMFKNRTVRQKYVVLANCCCYVFASDDQSCVYEECVVISTTSNVRVCEDGVWALKFEGDRGIEFQCQDKEEMIVWLECFRDAIEEVKGGRRTVSFQESSRKSVGSNHSRNSNITNNPQSEITSPQSAPNAYRRPISADDGMRKLTPSYDGSLSNGGVSTRHSNSASSSGSWIKSSFFEDQPSHQRTSKDGKDLLGKSNLFAQSKTEEARKKKAEKDEAKKRKIEDQLLYFAENFV